VLVAGVPRSGTTWIASALAATEDAAYVHEPDNQAHHPFAYLAKRGLGAYPSLQPGDPADDYARCWDAVFTGTDGIGPRPELVALLETLPVAERRQALAPGPLPPAVTQMLDLATPKTFATAPRHRVVKSVHAALSLRWIVARWQPEVLVVRRHPLDVLASWQDNGFLVYLHDDDHLIPAAVRRDLTTRLGCPPPPEEPATLLVRAAWLIGVLTEGLDDAIRSVPDIRVVDHELVCRDPVGELRWLAQRLGLAWSRAADAFVTDSRAPGTGDELRRISEALPGRWPERLGPRELRDAGRVLAAFPFAGRYDGLRS
jgi:hypothetical protein